MTIYLAILRDTAWGWGLSQVGALAMAEREAAVDGMVGEELAAEELAAWLNELRVIEVNVRCSDELGVLLKALELKERCAA